MAVLNIAKVVGALPGTLVADTIYAVRTGVGFDLYVSDATGSVAHPLNVPIIPPGTVQSAYRKTEPAGWIWADGRSIGPTGSSADREGAEYEALFAHLFDEFDDTEHPLSANNRAYYGTAAAAWSAGDVTIALPDSRGRILVTQDNMGGTAANRVTVAGSGVNGAVVGATGGEETHLLTANESGIPAHTHNARQVSSGVSATPGSGAVNHRVVWGSSATSANTAQNAVNAHNNMPPSLVLPLFIKL